MRFDGKVAVVTGGSSGIGLAAAQRFVAEGGYVFITGRRQSELDKAVATIGHQVTAVQGDLADLDDLDRLFATVKSEKGGLDVIVSSAGFIEPVTLEHVTPEHFDKTFDLNVRGTLFTVQKALPLFNDNGSIVMKDRLPALKGLRPSASTAPARQPCAPSLVPGCWNLKNAESG